MTIILFASFYLLTKRYLMYETDRSLSIHAAQIAYSISLSTCDLHDTQTKDILNLSQKEVPGIFVDIIDTQGLSIDRKLSDFQSLSIEAINKGSPAYIQTKLGDLNMRVIAYPIRNVDSVLGSVVMGHPIDVFEKTLAQLRNVGIILLLFLIIPSILIGYFLAKSATAPITKLGLDISKITSENLSRKVEVLAKTEETEVLINNFNSLLNRLSKAFNLERQFLGEMAHEIKTPLAVIKSNSEVALSKKRSPEEYQESIKQTLDQVDKLSRNMESLMDFAWSQSTDLTKTFKRINLSQVLSEISSVAHYVASPKNIRINSNIEENILVLGKEEKLYQAIYNIVDNAVKFTPENGEVDIELYKKEDHAVIKIKDTGIGISQEQQKDIFNRFYRTEQNKNIAGHGLGLAITDSIIKAHEGLIKVDSKKGYGSTFTISLRILS
ncbi:MAG: HAMP domain-containing sensor histidine kinase [Patescibacteria group bacterium]